MRSALSTLLWFVVHLALCGLAFASFACHVPVNLIIAATILAVGLISAWHAAHWQRWFDIHMFAGVGCAALSFSFFLLWLGWAIGMEDEQRLTLGSFIRSLNQPMAWGDIAFFGGIAILLPMASGIGQVVGYALRRVRAE